MLEIPFGVTARLPVILQDVTGTAVNSILAAGVTFTIMKSNGQQIDLVISSSEWVQLTGAAYSANGYYNVLLSSTYINVTGVMQYCAKSNASQPYFGVIKVAYDTNNIYDRLGQPVSGTISNDIQNVPAAASSGGFTANDRAMLSSTYYTSSLLPVDPASNSFLSGVIATSFNATDRTNLGTIRNSTNALPADPASNATINGYINSAVSNVNANSNARATEIKGTGWLGTYDTLHSMSLMSITSTFNITSSLSSTIANSTNYLAGAGFIVGTDDLHNISIQIQGITPSSGGGGFSTSDRALLVSAYSSTILLPADPASNSYLSGIITSSAARIMGSGAFGGGSGSTLYEAVRSPNNGIQYVAGKVFYLPNSIIASQVDITDVKGTGWSAGVDSLHAISNAISSQSNSSSFTSADRLVLSGTYATATLIYNTDLQIKSKTDNLPTVPANQTTIDSQFLILSSSLSVSGGFSGDDRNNIAAIKAKTDNLPAQPADATVTFGNSDRSQLSSIYTKTNALPADPVSTAYVQLVSQSLEVLIRATSASVSTVSSSIQVVSASVYSLSTKIGTPSTTIAGDISSINSTLGGVATNSANAANYSQAASTSAATAAINSTAAAIGTTNILNNQTAQNLILGTPKSGSLAADIHDTRDNVSGGGGGGSTDISGITRVLGVPNKTISEDLRQVGKIVQDIQKKVR